MKISYMQFRIKVKPEDLAAFSASLPRPQMKFINDRGSGVIEVGVGHNNITPHEAEHMIQMAMQYEIKDEPA